MNCAKKKARTAMTCKLVKVKSTDSHDLRQRNQPKYSQIRAQLQQKRDENGSRLNNQKCFTFVCQKSTEFSRSQTAQSLI